ncbi:MAG TPA: hypothetical protein VGM88_22050 [Kofleriaceae bacterium]|jgi:hypothetical protein
MRWLCLLLLAACGASSGGSGPDPQSGPDAMLDAAPDAAIDAAPVDAYVPPDVGPPQTVAFDLSTWLAGDPSITLPMPAPQIELHTDFLGIGSAPLPFTTSTTGPFSLDHIYPNDTAEPPGGGFYAFVNYTGTAYGHVSGTFDITWLGVTSSYDIEEDIYPVEVVTPYGLGSVSFSPAPIESTPCAGFAYLDGSIQSISWCWDYGTVVTATAHPDPGQPFYGWSDPTCGSNPTCSFTLNQPVGYLTAYFGAPLEVDMTGSGDVAVIQDDQVVEMCNASCTVVVDPTQPVDILASTMGTFVGFDGVAGTANIGGGQETLAAGTSSVAVAFTALPAERWYPATGAAFDANGNLAVSTWSSTTLYDATYTPLWTAAGGERPSFDTAGNLYTVADSEGEDATGWYYNTAVAEFSPTGAPLSSNTIMQRALPFADATVLPTGGVAIPTSEAGSTTTITLFSDAATTQTATATIPAGSEFCLGVDGTTLHVVSALGGLYADGDLYAFALDGTSLGDDGGDWDWCAWGHNFAAGGAFVGYSENQGWVAWTRNARVVNNDSWLPPQDHGPDWGNEWPFNVAATDADGNLYYQESPPPVPDNWGIDPYEAHGLRLRKYVDNSGVPVAGIERDPFYATDERDVSDADYFRVGISVTDVSVAPDGRIALTVLYVAAGSGLPTPYVIVLPPL